VRVGYWDGFVPNVEGMASDGIHLNTDKAKQTYAQLIKSWADTPPGA